MENWYDKLTDVCQLCKRVAGSHRVGSGACPDSYTVGGWSRSARFVRPKHESVFVEDYKLTPPAVPTPRPRPRNRVIPSEPGTLFTLDDGTVLVVIKSPGYKAGEGPRRWLVSPGSYAPHGIANLWIGASFKDELIAVPIATPISVTYPRVLATTDLATQARRPYDLPLQSNELQTLGTCMSNLLTGAAWAMLWRGLLRLSKRHFPVWGIKPMHGGPWQAIEGARAFHALVKNRGGKGYQDAEQLLGLRSQYRGWTGEYGSYAMTTNRDIMLSIRNMIQSEADRD